MKEDIICRTPALLAAEEIIIMGLLHCLKQFHSEACYIQVHYFKLFFRVSNIILGRPNIQGYDSKDVCSLMSHFIRAQIK